MIKEETIKYMSEAINSNFPNLNFVPTTVNDQKTPTNKLNFYKTIQIHHRLH